VSGLQSNWKARHTKALREYLAKGMSFSETAAAINARFHTAYSRNATIGRAKRLGLAAAARPGASLRISPKRPPKAEKSRLHQSRERHIPDFMPRIPAFEPTEMPRLRCVEIVPRHLALVELEPGDCRYPCGGDEEGEAITFCGHPQQGSFSYCTAHFQLTRNPDSVPERPAGTVMLRLVEVA
jgi:GcrA cell cycle regulator